MTAVSIRATNDAVNLIIEINGEAMPAFAPVSTVEVIRQANRIPFARLKISDGSVADGDFVYSSEEYFVPGNEIKILAGYLDNTQVIFFGIVLRQRVVIKAHRSWLEIECRDPAVKMTLSRKSRYYEDMSDSDIAESLISEYELTADISVTDAVHPQLFQYHATDWDFMISRLETNGQLCVIEDGTIRSYVPNLDGEPTIDIVYGDTLIELDAEFDARNQSTSIRSMAWDPVEQSLIEVDATDPAWEANNNLTATDMTNATGRDEDLLLHGGSLTNDALQAWADGNLVRSHLAGARGRARFTGISEVKPGDILRLSSISDRFNGKIHVCGIRHQFAKNQWTTDIEFGLPRTIHSENYSISHLPAAGLSPSVNGLQVGVVTQLADDPAGENRVRVKIPVAGMDEQGVWARVATLDAGAERGTFFRPELDDEVVLGFFHDDPAHPIILGMLHSSAKPPPIEPTEDNHEKAYISREGLKFHFDDDQKIITLETPGGNKLVLTDADSGILLEDQNGNTLTMDSNGISLVSAAEIKLEAATDLKSEAVNCELKASAEFKAEGSASAEISSSGMLTVKGSLVQIN